MRLDRQFRQASDSQEYRAYLKRRHSWDNVTIDAIDWPLISRAIGNLQGNELTIIQKFMHGLLPTYNVLQQRDPRHATSCPLCAHDTDSNIHMLSCQHPNMQFIVQGLVNELNTIHHSSNSCPKVHQSLQSIITQGGQPAHTECSLQQKKIGSREMTQRWWHFKWCHQQAQHYASKKPPAGWSSERWGTECLLAMWRGIIALWRQRCAEIHDTEAGRRNVSAEIERRIRALQAEGEKLDHVPRQAFARPVEEILSRTLEGQRTWVGIMQSVLSSQRKLQSQTQHQQK